MYPAGVAIWQRVAEISSFVERISNKNDVIRLTKKTEHLLTLSQSYLNTHNALQKLYVHCLAKMQLRNKHAVADVK